MDNDSRNGANGGPHADQHIERLASKVDALTGKGKVDPLDRNIPVLTDLIDAPEWKPDAMLAGVEMAEAPLASSASSNPLGALDDTQIDQLSHEIFARVSQRIDAELGTALEARLTEHLHSQVSAAVSHVLADMKMSIANEIGDAVNAALADRLRNTVRK